MFKFIRKMIYIGKQLLTSLFVGKGRENPDVYAGNVKVYPDTAPEPVITYTVTNILTHLSGSVIKVNGSNEAYITATVTEYHDGKVYATRTETATTFTSLYKLVDVGNGRLRYDVDGYGWTESAASRVTVKFTMRGGEYSVLINVEANEMHIDDNIQWVADSFPSSTIEPEGEEIFIYPEYRHTRKRVYTSGKESVLFTELLAGSCNIYFDYGQGEELWGDDVAVTTGGAAQRFNFPANRTGAERDVRFRVEAYTIGGEDVYGQYADVILNLTQSSVAFYRIYWTIENLPTENVSLNYETYVALPKSILGGGSLVFYVKGIEDCEFNIKEDGVTKSYYPVWEDDSCMSVHIDDIQGNLSITVFGIPLDPPTPPVPTSKFRIIQDSCIQCGNCLDTCRFGAVSMNNDVYTIDSTKCVGCGECAEVCPVSAIEEYEA